MTDVICAEHAVDQIVQFGKHQIIHVAKGIAFHFGFAHGKEGRKEKENSHTCRSKCGCVIPEVIALAKEWGWL